MGAGGEPAAKGTTKELGGRLPGSVLRLRPGRAAMPGRTLDGRGVFMVTSSFRVPRIAAKPHDNIHSDVRRPYATVRNPELIAAHAVMRFAHPCRIDLSHLRESLEANCGDTSSDMLPSLLVMRFCLFAHRRRLIKATSIKFG
jgi:hypothetical protein